MPQSSLMGWLNKPAPAKPAPPAETDEKRQEPAPSGTSENQSHAVSDHSPDQHAPTHAQSSPKVKVTGLPLQVELRECRQEDIKSFKRLNSLLLPIPYSDSFYREIMQDAITSSITLMALWRDSAEDKGTLVGAIRCRLLNNVPGPSPSIPRKDGPMLYLSTLVLLSPYRGHGIAAKMLDVMIKRAVNDYGVASVGAHVWEANDEGLAWYRKRGFKEAGREEGYYRKLKPQGAVVMVKNVGVMDLLED